MLDKIFDKLQTVCLGCEYYVTTECAQTICTPLLQNAQYATEVRRFSAHTRNRCVMKITKYPDVLALQYWPRFYTYFAIDFSERAIPANIDRSILLTARMGRYGVKVALLRCLIWLIMYNIITAPSLSIYSPPQKRRRRRRQKLEKQIIRIRINSLKCIIYHKNSLYAFDEKNIWEGNTSIMTINHW